MSSHSASAKKLATDEHLSWLVKSRSKNQKSTLKLRKLMFKHADRLVDEKRPRIIARLLLDINFSLWRAVFLSDLQEGTESIINDASKFIDELIENNTITYSQDKGTREYTFMYYMGNARYRLEQLAEKEPKILPTSDFPKVSNPSDKGWWSHHQRAVNKAIAAFGRELES